MFYCTIFKKFFFFSFFEDFLRFISKPKSQCLQNQPRLDPTYKSAVCCNGKVEEGEQCDCGNKQVGTNLENYIPELHQKVLIL